MLNSRERSVDRWGILLITILLWIGSLVALVAPSLRLGWAAMSVLRKAASTGAAFATLIGVGFLLYLLSSAGTRNWERLTEAVRRRLPGRGLALALWALSLAVLPGLVGEAFAGPG